MSKEDGSVWDVGAATESVNSGADDAPVHTLESLCMRCGENGTTRFLITRIPHFREVVLMAFECPHCNERNNEVQFAGQVQPQGCTYTLSVPAGDPKVLNRQVVKSDSGTIRVPELDFEVPPEAQRGTLSTVGFLDSSMRGRMIGFKSFAFIATFIFCVCLTILIL